MEKKEFKYEKPELFSIDNLWNEKAFGMVQCKPGSTPGGQCQTGGHATSKCQTGYMFV